MDEKENWVQISGELTHDPIKETQRDGKDCEPYTPIKLAIDPEDDPKNIIPIEFALSQGHFICRDLKKGDYAFIEGFLRRRFDNGFDEFLVIGATYLRMKHPAAVIRQNKEFFYATGQ